MPGSVGSLDRLQDLGVPHQDQGDDDPMGGGGNIDDEDVALSGALTFTATATDTDTGTEGGGGSENDDDAASAAVAAALTAELLALQEAETLRTFVDSAATLRLTGRSVCWTPAQHRDLVDAAPRTTCARSFAQVSFVAVPLRAPEWATATLRSIQCFGPS